MKSLFLVFLAVSAVAAESFYCTPGASFKMDCNTCSCSSDGKSAACTDMRCPEGNANVNDIDTARAQPLCEPGERFKLDDCSSCICNAAGTTAECTLGFCDNFKTRMAPRKSQYCEPGRMFSPDNCNLCKCSNDGTKAVCTMKLCEARKARSANDQYCEAGRMFSPDNCNLCKCSNDGTKAMCTQKLCQETEVTKQVCQPLSQFKDYCNTCTCSEDGSSYACTRMYCDKDIWNRDGSLKILNSVVLPERVCQPGKAYSPDGCNTCVCNRYGTGQACTSKLCLSNLKAAYQSVESKKWGPLYKDGEACIPGRAFYSECNECVCTRSGRSAFCTLMSCPTSP
ncbi:tenascin [Nasonia vitripennis]|uniref:Pacifastin domain-containing protein n=1 Tax=Nasonia vitripennis TaxID=7425 RepID=A0A7M7LQJ4_NASVI|nr:tenascin [Nasonia vitripennis]